MDTLNQKIAALLCFASMLVAAPVLAEVTFQYVYDNNGQLVKSIDSTGVVIEYVYDAVGNRLETRRYDVDGLAIFGLSPGSGPVGQKVLIQGQNFSDVLAVNQVTFNGVAAAVLSGSNTSLMVRVPEGATSGPIKIVVGPTNLVETAEDFIVIPAPSITAVDPVALKSKGSEVVVVETFTVTGRNLTDAVFRFEPQFSPPAIAVASVSIDISGSSATLRLTVKENVSGSFSVVAKNDVGESDPILSSENTVLVFDENADSDGDLVTDYDEQFLCTDYLNPDSDGDSFTDKDEQSYGSDPCDVASTPWTLPDAVQPADILKQASGSLISILNSSLRFIKSGSLINEATGPVFTLLNSTLPPIDNSAGAGLHEATGPLFSLLNQSAPPVDSVVGSYLGEAAGPVFSLMNESAPPTDGGTGAGVGEATGASFSILNSAVPVIDETANGVGEATGPALTVEAPN